MRNPLRRWMGFPDRYFRLTLRLLRDPRVPAYLKLLPLASLLYLLFPDLFPGPLDDVTAFFVGMYLFVRLSPQEVVQEYLEET